MKKEKRSNVVFYNLMGIMLVLFLISLVVTGGKSIYQFLFYVLFFILHKRKK